jgi:hypothetical protein
MANAQPAPDEMTGSRGKACIGVVAPVSNTNLEPDLNMLRPEGV